MARASQMLTLKMGDVVFVQMPAEIKAVQDSSVRVLFNGVELLNFQVN